MGNVLLLIDPQTDFCSENGALSVPGALLDLFNISKLLETNLFDHVIISLDFHPIYHIAHPEFWRDAHGNIPAVFTQISAQQVLNKEFTPVSADVSMVVDYLQKLETQSNFPHILWPLHCIMGTPGANIDSSLLPSLHHWSFVHSKNYQIEIKGTNPFCEHFGIFEAQIPMADAPETQLNTTLLNQLLDFDQIFLAGEAKSHCVANSLNQMLNYSEAFAKKIIVLEDCMSDVPNLGHLGEPIYSRAKNLGMKLQKSIDFVI